LNRQRDCNYKFKSVGETTQTDTDGHRRKKHCGLDLDLVSLFHNVVKPSTQLQLEVHKRW